MHLTPFEILFLAHNVIDVIFQTNKQAEGKLHNTWPLVSHCLVYATIMTVICMGVFGFSYEWIPFMVTWPYWMALNITLIWTWPVIMGVWAGLFGSHVILDNKKLIIWMVRNIKGKEHEPYPWLVIWVDQILHWLVLAIIVTVMG